MDLAATGLREQPFRHNGKPISFVPYKAQEEAFEYLKQVCSGSQGVGLFCGPSPSGKTTLLRRFIDELPDDRAAAIVDAAELDEAGLLCGILSQFGYPLELSSTNELLNMLKVFVMQQAESANPPLLIIENAHAMHEDTLGDLCKLAALKLRRRFAVKIILTSDRSLTHFKDLPGLGTTSGRMVGEFHLGSLTRSETRKYLSTKLLAAGCKDYLKIAPRSFCNEIYTASQGWPGVIDRLVMLAITKMKGLPLDASFVERPAVPPKSRGGLGAAQTIADNSEDDGDGEVEPPLLFVTLSGETLDETVMDRSRYLIGRSQHNDLSITSKHISRHHALLVRQGTVTLLMDLNSRNGTYVNSRRVSSQVLMHDDIITIGHHGIKFSDPQAKGREALDGRSFTETVIMRNLEDMRRMLARETTRVLPNKKRSGTESDR